MKCDLRSTVKTITFGAGILFLAGILVATGQTPQAMAQQTEPAAEEPQQEDAKPSPEAVAAVNAKNAECLSCHTEAGAVTADPTIVDLEALSKVLIDPVAMQASNHTGMTCISCHVGSYEGFPHSGPLQEVPGRHETLDCVECHSLQTWRIEPQVAHGAHGQNPKVFERFDCNSCHDSHVFQSASKLKDPVEIIAQDNGMCLSCHDSELRFAEFTAGIIPVPEQPDINVIHQFLADPERHWSSVRCIECHTPASETPTLNISHKILTKEEARRDCVTCHSADTHLSASLYRYAAEQRDAEDAGFENAQLLSKAYVVGATRNTKVDQLGMALLALILAGIALHILGRVIGRLMTGGKE
ncbi:cytochrome c3 family protein [Tropicimonas sp. IMCC6043]|uniref:cytochrome c3 family protein n=1 Tax=Tropicimonas sp. IMCC6043 TaxID=2510645 RepID=UPI0013EA9A40|nr:cytochrome c3 family protein [Tropicimonas sp. IMCC6043]